MYSDTRNNGFVLPPHLSLYEQALRYKQEGDYTRAFNLFHDCLSFKEIDRGDILFHCGWCLEQDKNRDLRQALSFYREAAEVAADITCKMNSCFRAGWLLMHEKDFRGAAEDFLKSLQLGNENSIRNDIYRSAAYWLAVCLEAQGLYLKALEYYRMVQKIAPSLDPESRFREINCLNHIGAFEKALEVCTSFEKPAPPDFPEDRYRELQELAQKEKQILLVCLSDKF